MRPRIALGAATRRVRGVGGFGTLLMGFSSAQVVALLAAPLLTRVFDPAEVGAYGTALALVSIVVGVSSLCYEQVIPIAESEGQANALERGSFLILGFTLVLAVLLWPFMQGVLSTLLGVGISDVTGLLLLLSLAGAGAAQVLTSRQLRDRAFGRVAQSRFAQTGGIAIGQVVLGLLRLGVTGLLLGDVIGRAIGTLLLAGGRPPRDSVTEPRVPIRVALRRFRHFALLSSPSVLLNTLTTQIPLFILLAWYSPAVAGAFVLVQRIGGVPITLFSLSLTQYSVSEAGRLRRESPREVRPYFVRTTSRSLRVAAGPAILITVLAPLLTPIVFGSDWTQAGWFLAIMTPSYLANVVTSPLGSALSVTERQDLRLLREVIRLALTVVAIIPAVLGAPAAVTVIAISAVSVMECLVYAWVSMAALDRHAAIDA